MITKPTLSHGWLDTYIAKIEITLLLDAFEKYSNSAAQFYSELPAAAWDFSYAHGKWTIKEILLHLTDCERVFIYRALMFARGETNPLPGFDEDMLVANSYASGRTVHSLLDERFAVRNASIEFYKNLDPKAALLMGAANNSQMCAAGLGFSMLGHELHHIEVIRDRYLPMFAH